MAKQVMPEARLESRPTDVRLTDEQFLGLSLFAALKRKPSLDKFPGALRLRRFRAGEAVFRQGEAGWTAFYCLKTEDVVSVLENQVQANWRADADADDLEEWKERLEAVKRD